MTVLYQMIGASVKDRIRRDDTKLTRIFTRMEEMARQGKTGPEQPGRARTHPAKTDSPLPQYMRPAASLEHNARRLTLRDTAGQHASPFFVAYTVQVRTKVS
jgi:hypothetical protein